MLDWGSVPVWVGVAITLFGFLATVYQLRLGRQDRQEERDLAREDEAERRTAMARAVGVKIDWGKTDEARGVTSADVEIQNGGPYPVDGVVIVIEADEYPKQVLVGTLLAGVTMKQTHEVRRQEVVFGESTSGASLLFTDAYGKHWSRTGQDLVQVEDPPHIC